MAGYIKHLLAGLFLLLIFFESCKKDKGNILATVTTTSVNSVTSSSVQTGGNVSDDGGSSITYRGICWATHTNPTLSDSVTHDGSGSGSFSSSLVNLSPNVKYYIKAYAINSIGTAYGNEINFTTSQGLPVVTTSSVTDIGPSEAECGGNIISDGGAAVTARGIVWSTSPNPTISDFKTTDGTGVGTFTSAISSLVSQTTYYVRAYATNSQGTAYGDQVQFTSSSSNTVTDIDGNVYPYVTLCGESWMATNLKVTKYRNGDPITNGSSGFNWSTSTTGAYVFPNGQNSKVDSFGLLYNIYAINDSRGVCPTGWHVPSDAEWKAVEICEGMSSAEADLEGYRGTIASVLREGGSSGLNLRLGGYVFQDGSYQSIYTRGYFWSSTAGISGNYYRAITNPENATNGSKVRRESGTIGSAVRCVKD